MDIGDFESLATLDGEIDGLFICPQCAAVVADRSMAHELDSNRMKHLTWHRQREDG